VSVLDEIRDPSAATGTVPVAPAHPQDHYD
jgi:hypothetical protein